MVKLPPPGLAEDFIDLTTFSRDPHQVDFHPAVLPESQRLCFQASCETDCRLSGYIGSPRVWCGFFLYPVPLREAGRSSDPDLSGDSLAWSRAVKSCRRKSKRSSGSDLERFPGTINLNSTRLPAWVLCAGASGGDRWEDLREDDAARNYKRYWRTMNKFNSYREAALQKWIHNWS